MKKEYKIEQFPKYTPDENRSLSLEQEVIRSRKRKIFEYGAIHRCKDCGVEQPIAEFYVKDKSTGRRANQCRDCRLKKEGVLEVGKYRFAMKIFDKGFRRCSICKDIKPVTEYAKSKKSYGGYSNTCNPCAHQLHVDYMKKQSEDIGDTYVKQYGIKNYNYKISDFTDELIEKLRREIIENRKPIYFLDDKGFFTVADFALYVEERYGVLQGTVKKRIQDGYTEQECIISEHEARSNAYTMGKIQVIDTVTGQEFIFKNTQDKELWKMFSRYTITRCIQTGQKTQVTTNSKYKNPCFIKRI